MQVGSLVRYQCKYPDGIEIDWLGIVIDSPADNPNKHSQWLSESACGLRQWRHTSVLEVICK